MITFDRNGYLTPPTMIEADYKTLVEHFVTTEIRWEIFEDYKQFIDALKEAGLKNFYQWINGSFTTKFPRPNDIDVVTFIDHRNYDLFERQLREIKKTQSKVDSYFVRDYPESHANHFVTNFDKMEWLHLFSTDRMRRKKGFIQIDFN